MNSNHIHGLAATTRASNIPSVAGNVILGAVVCVATYPHAQDAELLAPIITLILAGIFLYLSGNFFNDWADRNWDALNRPERALPRALFPPKLYLFLALSGGGLGLAFSATINLYTLISSLLLVGCILLYTWLHKRCAAAVILMGLCRTLLPVMGYFGLAPQELLSSPAWETSLTTLALASGSLFCHIAGLSLGARRESAPAMNGQAKRFDWLLYPSAALLMFVAAFHFLRLPPLACMVGLVPYAIWIVLCLTLFRKPISARVSRLLAGIPLVDWMLLLPIILALGSGTLHEPFALICGLFSPLAFISALALQRHSPAT